jgi:zinc protease
MATIPSSLVQPRRGLAPTRRVLDNGLVLLAKATHTTPAVTISLAVRAGSICDPIHAPGATYLLSRVIDRGTATRSADHIAEELDGRGISLNISVTRHLFSLSCTCLADDFEPVLALLGDMLMSPSIPAPELATHKGEVVTSIRQDDDNPAVRAVEALMALLYPNGHPYGRRTKGTVDVVERLTREQLAELHAHRFVPAAVTAVVVGDVDPARAHDVVARVFAGWPAEDVPPVRLPLVPSASHRQRLVIPMMNKAQADIAYGFTTITRADPAYYAFWLMNHVFGQYSMSGRLGDRIREREGMAYYVYSTLDANVVEGPLIVRAGVSPANVDRALASIEEEVARLVSDGITERELADSRRYLIYAMPRATETNAGIAAFLQNAEFFGLGLDYDVRLPGLLEAVTLDEVNTVARRLIDPGRAAVVIAGPYGGAGIG